MCAKKSRNEESNQPTTLQRALAENVRTLRKRRGWSQEKLAEYANVDRTTISKIERGIGNTGMLALEDIAKALGIEPAMLLMDTRNHQTSRVISGPRLVRGTVDHYYLCTFTEDGIQICSLQDSDDPIADLLTMMIQRGFNMEEIAARLDQAKYQLIELLQLN